MESEKTKEQVRSILGPSKENEFLQSFVRVGIQDDEDEKELTKPNINKRTPNETEKVGTEEIDADNSSIGEKKVKFKHIKSKLAKKTKKKTRKEEEVYTDKDRAAAVVMGSRDIKQSLSMKVQQERTQLLHLPMETDSNTLLALGRSELRSGRVATALQFVDKALELSPGDEQALVARSKCNLLLGDPKAALADAEAAQAIDKDFVRAVYYKSEALYYSGEFELSLMFYHRGLRMRPDLQEFRLGIQKAQEAIENTIGGPCSDGSIKNKMTSKPSKTKRSRSLVTQLMADKTYLENFLKNPNLCIANKRNEVAVKQAEEALEFLKNREKFWRQQQI